MPHEHQAGFPKLPGNWKPLVGPERALIKRLFQIDFAATSRATAKTKDDNKNERT
jgi:hypothetical protein